MKRIILAIFFYMISFNFVLANEITTSELLDRYEANRKKLKTHIIKCEESLVGTGSLYGDETRSIKTAYEFRTDGHRVDVATVSEFTINGPNLAEPYERSDQKRVIWDGSRWVNHVKSVGQNEEGFVWISLKEEKKEDFVAKTYGGSVLDGIFEGDIQPIESILRQASDISVRSQKENVSGIGCYVIDAVTSHGKYSLWIDPEHGYNIAKAKVNRKNGDIAYGKTIGQDQEKQISAKPGTVKAKQPLGELKLGALSEILFSLDKVEFDMIDDQWVPVSADYQYTFTFDDGRSLTEKIHHKRTHIDLNPDFEAVGAFVPNIPDGTRVNVEYVPGIKFEWFGGEIVPVIDKLIISELDSMSREISAETFDPVENIKVDTKKPVPPISHAPLQITHEVSAEVSAKKGFTTWRSLALVILACLVLIGVWWFASGPGQKKTEAK